MPIPIQEGRPTNALRRAFKFVGRIAPRLDETISPVALTADVSGELPPGVLPFGTGAFGVTAVPAQVSFFLFRTPPNTLAVITNIILGSSAADQIVAGVPFATSPATTGTGTREWTDGRMKQISGNGEPSCEILTGTGAAPVAFPSIRLTAPALPDYRQFPVEIPVGGGPTGGVLVLASVTANLALRGTLQWREYPIVTAIL